MGSLRLLTLDQDVEFVDVGPDFRGLLDSPNALHGLELYEKVEASWARVGATREVSLKALFIGGVILRLVNNLGLGRAELGEENGARGSSGE